MTGVTLRYLRNESAAFEVLNAAFLKVFSGIHTFEFRGKGSLRAWVKRITTNECLMHLRRAKRALEVVGLPEDYEGPVQLNVDHIDGEFLHQCICDLPERARLVFNMYVVDGFNHNEIANLLGIAVSSSRSQLNYARNVLKKKLKKYGHD